VRGRAYVGECAFDFDEISTRDGASWQRKQPNYGGATFLRRIRFTEKMLIGMRPNGHAAA
jgi:hypothetical protein